MKSLVFALPLIAGLAAPAMAEDMSLLITVFKYSDTAMKAMTENPQDRARGGGQTGGSVRREDGGRLLVFVRW